MDLAVKGGDWPVCWPVTRRVVASPFEQSLIENKLPETVGQHYFLGFVLVGFFNFAPRSRLTKPIFHFVYGKTVREPGQHPIERSVVGRLSVVLAAGKRRAD